MTEETQGTTTSIDTSAAPPVAAPVAAATDAPASTGAASSTPTEAAPAWTPTWQYELADGRKGEIDEFFRPLAKDEETLKRLVEHHKRAQLSDTYKKDMLEYKSRIGEYEPTVRTVEKLRDWFENGKHERVLSELGYTDDMIFEIAKQKLARMRDPNVQALHQEKTQADLAHEKLLAENEAYKSQAMENLARVTQFELDSELGKAEVQPIQAAYDKAYGSGAFKQLVIERGAILVDRAGKHIPPSELIPMVAKEFAPFVQGNAPGTAAVDPTTPQSTQPQPTAPAPRKVIPVVKGSGSPTKGGVRSLDDLRKLARG